MATQGDAEALASPCNLTAVITRSGQSLANWIGVRASGVRAAPAQNFWT
jgi:hypothetical protein